MTAPLQPFREPVRATALRTGILAAVFGAAFALSSRGLVGWPTATVLMLWPALGGHFVELWWLNWLRSRLPRSRGVQVTARLAVWFVGGVVLALGMALTARALGGDHPARTPRWWVGGFGFIALELVVHLVLRSRGQASFYDGRG